MQEHAPHISIPSSVQPIRRWQVVCLCAEWCGVCRQYRMDFERLAARFPESAFVWIDVEERADLLGDIDIETFPSLVIGDGRRVRFAGPLTPQPEVLARLIESLQHQSFAAATLDADPSGEHWELLKRIPNRA